jgi:glycosyltransferase involved in cell wall biosynthesis
MAANALRILLIVFNQVGHGTYWRAYYFGRELARRGHAVSLMAVSPRERFCLTERQADGMQLVETPDWLPGSLRSGWDVWDTCRRMTWISTRSFDIVHAFEARPVVLLPALWAQRRGATLVMDWCDWFGRGGSVEERQNPILRTVLRPIETFFEERFRNRASGTTVINRFLGARALALGVPAETILLLRNGASTIAQPLDRAEARNLLGFAPDGIWLGYVGGAFSQDAEFMAQAFIRVRQVNPNVRLLLIGHFNRPIEPIVKDASAVVRTGPVTTDKLYLYLSACDLCWLPMRDSGANRGRWPMKLSDYMSAGRPVVATRVGDLPEVVEGYQIGQIAADDPVEFAACTIDLLAHTRQLEMLGQAARFAAEGDFSWLRLTDQLEGHYRRLLAADAAHIA